MKKLLLILSLLLFTSPLYAADLVIDQSGGNFDVTSGSIKQGGTAVSLSTHNHDTVYCRWRGSSASEPATPIDGDIWNDTTSGNVLKIYANSGWQVLN